MSLGGFILKNALRNKRRSFLTVASVAISLFLFVTLQVAIREMTIPPEDVSASLRIAVRNKISHNLCPLDNFRSFHECRGRRRYALHLLRRKVQRR